MKIIIVEDDPLLRENLQLLLSGDAGIEIAGSFGSAEEALHVLQDLHPDILLADLGLPGISGVELIKKAREQMPGLDIIAHTIFEDRESVFSAIKSGAAGYILKGSSPRELIEALYNLHGGGAPMSPKIARKVVLELQNEGVSEQYLLSQREREVIRYIESGLTYKEIAGQLSISTHTVHTHIKHIYEKLQAKNRQEALTKARKKGMI
jgi:DNA-binding NarL/FixJ family response regulator